MIAIEFQDIFKNKFLPMKNLYNFEEQKHENPVCFPAILTKDDLKIDNLTNSNSTPYKFDEKYNFAK